MLTSDTEVCFHNFVPPAMLQSTQAKTFADAILVTRCLGFRYIWIDAICINQTGSDEKINEIARMHHIYSQAKVNLSATSAGNGSEGMIFDRDLSKAAPLILRASLPEASETFSHNMIVYPNRWFREIARGVVNTRGWVYQERFLASRVIHFCRDQITWECRDLQASEFHPGHHPFILPNGRYTKMSHYAILGRDGTPQLKTADLKKLDEAWHRLCEQYSSTELTYPTDKLLAISAVARSICTVSSLSPGDYIGGLWKAHLPGDLKWCVSHGRRPQTDVYCAPSWSWAATNASIMWKIKGPTQQMQSLVNIIKVSLKTVGDDPFGLIISGVLQLEGVVWKIFRQKLNRDTWQIGWGQQFGVVSLFECQSDQEHTKFINSTRRQIIRVTWDQDFDQSVADMAVQVYYIMPLTLALNKDHTGLPSVDLDGLVLRRADMAGQYHRVGFIENVRTASEAPECLADWIPNCCKLVAEEYGSKLDNGRYITEII